MLGIAGVTVIETKAAEVTVTVVEPVTEPEVAVMVAVPIPAPVARPAEVTLRTLVADELHVAVPVRF